MSDSLLYEKLITEDYEKGKQLRLVVNEFRDVQYLHIRIYYLDYEGNWVPTKEGVSMPISISNLYALMDGLIEIASYEEAKDSILKHFYDKQNI